MTTMLSESRSSISPEVSSPVDTGADTQSPVRTYADDEGLNRAAWQNLIDHKLIEWGRNPNQFADEDVEPISGKIVRTAIMLAQTWRDEDLAPPHSVAPDPNGGIVFERRHDNKTEVFHLWDDGTVEYQQFLGARLISRHEL